MSPQKLQINPKHDIIRGIYKLFKSGDTEPIKLMQAKVVAQQVIHNAFIAAGMLEDARDILPDINNLMVVLLGGNPDISNLEKKREEYKQNYNNEEWNEPMEDLKMDSSNDFEVGMEDKQKSESFEDLKMDDENKDKTEQKKKNDTEK